MAFKKGEKSQHGGFNANRTPKRDSRPTFGKRPVAFGRNEGGRSDDRRSSGRREVGRNNFELFDARCDRCGKDCQIPFRPTGGKPVYCRECFNKHDEGARKEFPSDATAAELRELHRKVDMILHALDLDK